MTDAQLRSLYESKIIASASLTNAEAFFSFPRNTYTDDTYVNQNDEAAFQAWKLSNGY